MAKKSKQKEAREAAPSAPVKKHSLIPSLVVFLIFIGFVVFLSAVNDVSGKGSIPITGNAVLDTGQLNPNIAFSMLIIISIYAVIVCSYLSWRHRI